MTNKFFKFSSVLAVAMAAIIASSCTVNYYYTQDDSSESQEYLEKDSPEITTSLDDSNTDHQEAEQQTQSEVPEETKTTEEVSPVLDSRGFNYSELYPWFDFYEATIEEQEETLRWFNEAFQEAGYSQPVMLLKQCSRLKTLLFEELPDDDVLIDIDSYNSTTGEFNGYYILSPSEITQSTLTVQSGTTLYVWFYASDDTIVWGEKIEF